MRQETLVSVQNVSKKYCSDLNRSARYAVSDVVRDLLKRPRTTPVLRPGEFWALRDVSFELSRGQSVAVMGVNGAGKSTLLKMILGSLRLTDGCITTRGRVAALTEMGLGFDLVLSGRENAYMCATVLGIDRRRVDETFDEIVDFAGLEEFIDSPVQIYSSGMRARLGFSIAMYLEPDILLVDEVLTVGDIGFQRKCIKHAKRYLDDGGSMLFVSHNPHLVQAICDRCLLIDHGFLVFDGGVVDGVSRYFDLVHADPSDLLASDAAISKGARAVLAETAWERGAKAPAGEELPANPSEESGFFIEELGVGPVAGDAVRPNEPVRIHFRYRSSKDNGVRWGFSIHTADLETTIACDGSLETVHLPAGTGEIECRVPRLPLSAGRYAMRLAVLDADAKMPLALRGFHDSPIYFEVKMSTSLRNNYRMFMKDLIVLEGVTWEVRNPTASPLSALAGSSPASDEESR